MESEVLNLTNASKFADCAVNTFKAHILPKIPHQKVGRGYRIMKDDLAAYLRGRTPWKDSISTKTAQTGSSIRLSEAGTFAAALKRRTKQKQRGELGNG